MTMTGSKAKVAIIGGGISGLHTAYKLAQSGVNFQLFEASQRLGGRIFRRSFAGSNFDLGPSWYWPGQFRIESLVKELELSTYVFAQHATGDALYEPIGRPNEPVQRGVAGISMAGSCRVDGGLARVTERLAHSISALTSADTIRTDTPIVSLKQKHRGVELQSDTGANFVADKVVLALPTRVALETISFEPMLALDRQDDLNSVATWMAGHAKVVVVYERPFWRDAGLSGDVISQLGPLSEIHDASPKDEKTFALFGFLGLPAKQRLDRETQIKQDIVSQLVRLFGDAAAKPLDIQYKDWAADSLVATGLDQRLPNHHPLNQWKTRTDWQERLIWSGTEAAQGHYNGYIEGALLASEYALTLVQRQDSKTG
jgi:monoamine oxidase